jgi:hypothetical protein
MEHSQENTRKILEFLEEAFRKIDESGSEPRLPNPIKGGERLGNGGEKSLAGKIRESKEKKTQNLKSGSSTAGQSFILC